MPTNTDERPRCCECKRLLKYIEHNPCSAVCATQAFRREQRYAAVRSHARAWLYHKRMSEAVTQARGATA